MLIVEIFTESSNEDMHRIYFDVRDFMRTEWHLES